MGTSKHDLAVGETLLQIIRKGLEVYEQHTGEPTGSIDDQTGTSHMMLSPHFSLEELTASEVAARAGLDNAPPRAVVHHLLRLAEGLELVRAALGNNATSRADTARRRFEEFHAHARSGGGGPLSSLRSAITGLPGHRRGPVFRPINSFTSSGAGAT